VTCVSAASVFVLARAALAVTCQSSPLNTAAEANVEGRGNRVTTPGGMTVYNDSVTCARGSSLFVSDANFSTYVEVGWFEDPTPDTYQCLGNTTGSPKVFGEANLGFFPAQCATNVTLSTGADGFSVHDSNQDGVFVFGHDGSSFYTGPNLGSFNSGIVLTNGERTGDGNEPARSEFDSLDRQDANGWHSWTSPSEPTLVSDDPDFHECFDAGDHVRVIHIGTDC
jgi:hypothetical protein